MKMDIEKLRAQIDEIDNEITKLFGKRMEISNLVAQYKKENRLTVLDKSREREILSRVTELVEPELEIYTKTLFQTLFNLSRSYQNMLLSEDHPLRQEIGNTLSNTSDLFPAKAVVACQGVEGAYSQIAADKLFSLPSIMYFNTFEGVFTAVEKGLSRYGILPIENSSHGSVTQVYDLMKKHNFHIVRSLKLKIDHSLLAKKGSKLSDIKEIFSHEQAIGQCSAFLEGLKGVKVTVVENTAVAAQKVAESDRTDIAALSSHNCAELYGLTALGVDVQDNANNFTRFICISKNPEIYPGANKISLMLSLPHRPGSLYDTISRFSVLGLNLTKLESRPVPEKDFEFMFYFDIEASVKADSVVSLLCELASATEQFVFLGNYSEI
ncbi:MAG TPA: prephenate dehydratase domain-containing protein [Clostridiales bacterium]|jgi:chorismate mutase/prephenate dehydratase|nr:prephenate dehydratase domain-containing protein [Clostridiales bacterium]HRT81747.1 prephenate dehydratase domain-containing protein [Oscillospiraceae bacterium]